MKDSWILNVKKILQAVNKIDLQSNIQSASIKVSEIFKKKPVYASVNDKDVINQIIGKVIDLVFPVYDFNNIIFHRYSSEKDKMLPENFDDSSFYIEELINVKGSALNYYFRKKDELLRLVENKFVKDSELLSWFNISNGKANETRILSGAVGSGKTTFLKHIMCKYSKDKAHDSTRLLFLYFDCNPFIFDEISRRRLNGERLDTNWQYWMVHHFFTKIITKILLSQDGNLTEFYNSLKTFYATAAAAHDSEKLSAFFMDFIKEDPESALLAIIDYLRNNERIPGIPIIIIDNLDPFLAYPQIAAFRLLNQVSSLATIKSLLVIRHDSFLRVHKALPYNAAMLVKSYILTPCNYKAFCKKRLESIKDGNFDLSVFENNEIVSLIDKELDKDLVMENLGDISVAIQGTLRQNLSDLVTCILSKETQDFLFGITSGNLRSTGILLSNLFYNDVRNQLDFVERFLLKNPDEFKSHLINRLILTQNKGYFVSNKESIEKPEYPINIFQSFNCESNCSNNIINILFHTSINNDGIDTISKSDIDTLAPICKFYKDNPDKTYSCIYSNLDLLLRKNLLCSNGGEFSAKEAFDNDKKLHVTYAGNYYSKHLSSDMNYLSATRYDTFLPDTFHIYWENPTKKTPLLWQIASNTQFLIYLMLSEIRILDDSFKRIDSILLRNDIRILMNHSYSTIVIMEQFLQSVNQHHFYFENKQNKLERMYYKFFVKKLRECIDHAKLIEDVFFELEFS